MMIFMLMTWIVRPFLVTIGAISLIGYYSGQDISLLLDGIVATFGNTVATLVNIVKGGY